MGDIMGLVYDHARVFLKKYPGGITWMRVKKHAAVVEKHLNPGEKIIYVFVGQKNDSVLDVFSTAVVCLTNKRILVGQKRLVFGYTLSSITPDLFNDLQVYKGILFGKVTIDTIKECVIITNLSKKSLREIETQITHYMMEEKKSYASVEAARKTLPTE